MSLIAINLPIHKQHKKLISDITKVTIILLFVKFLFSVSDGSYGFGKFLIFIILGLIFYYVVFRKIIRLYLSKKDFNVPAKYHFNLVSR